MALQARSIIWPAGHREQFRHNVLAVLLQRLASVVPLPHVEQALQTVLAVSLHAETRYSSLRQKAHGEQTVSYEGEHCRRL